MCKSIPFSNHRFVCVCVWNLGQGESAKQQLWLTLVYVGINVSQYNVLWWSHHYVCASTCSSNANLCFFNDTILIFYQTQNHMPNTPSQPLHTWKNSFAIPKLFSKMPLLGASWGLDALVSLRCQLEPLGCRISWKSSEFGSRWPAWTSDCYCQCNLLGLQKCLSV